MTIEELKAMVETPGDIAYETLGARMADLAPEILALVEAVREDILDGNGEPCGCDRPVCATWRAFNAKLESL